MRLQTTLLPVLLTAPLALAQTSAFLECDPTKEDNCPNPPALGTDFNKTWDASDHELSKDLWNVTAGISGDRSLIDFDDEGMHFSILKHGDSVTVKTAFYIFFGSVEVKMRAAPGRGVISTLNLLSDDLDEIDWEIFGANGTSAGSNYYGKGDLDQLFGEYHDVQGAAPQEDFHTYGIEWTEDKLIWLLDGEVVREVGYAPAGEYPQTPSYVNLGLWAGGDPDNNEGTIEWAGGETEYDKGPFTMTIASIKVTDGHTNTSEYLYTDKSGSYESIEPVDGESKAYKAIHRKSTTEKATEEWSGLSKGAKIGIACGVLGFVACCIVAWTFVCITQRRKGKAERQAADQAWEKERADFDMYRVQMKSGGFGKEGGVGVGAREVEGGRF